MGFFSRLFSSDQRAASAAEAAGNFELAAQRYALAGRNTDAVRMHLARADRAKSRADEIEALRDALHWAKKDPEQSTASKALGKALLAQAQAEGIKTMRDKERVAEAAALLLQAESFEHAGDAFVMISDNSAATLAYKRGGLIAKMENILSQEKSIRDKVRSEKSGFADYDLHMRGGARDAAADSLRQCLQHTDSQSRYRRLLDELESRLITGGRVVLKQRNGKSESFCAVGEILIGRDSLCDLVLRTGGVSRRHASILVKGGKGCVTFALGDAGSRNGTRLGGIEIADRLPLRVEGSFLLGDHAEIHYRIEAEDDTLFLDIRKGIDKGSKLIASREEQEFSLENLGIAGSLLFRKGRPFLLHSDAVRLNGDPVRGSDIQLIHGDLITVDGVELEVG